VASADRPADIDLDEYEALRAAVARKLLYRGIKRALDVAASLFLLIVLAIPMLAIAAAIRLGSAGPVLYRTSRNGLGGKPFVMLKFRSMRVASPAEDAAFRASVRAEGKLGKSSGDPRVTGIGRWLRRFSLDELPQLINVLRGDMALIGPRPVMPEMLAPWPGFARARTLVRPGLGGLWQVRDRGNDTSVLPMWRHDIEYLTRMNLALDLMLIARTAAAAALTTGAR
jgi:lipopolysaccharide/colanic/teichoic acid biosynthesis glycosyltransferase